MKWLFWRLVQLGGVDDRLYDRGLAPATAEEQGDDEGDRTNYSDPADCAADYRANGG
jgi:hypothetical protein